MDILEVNTNTLAKLKAFDGFKDLYIEKNYLVYNGEKVDISKFNINDLLNGDSMFSSALVDLTSKEIFDIIRIHAMMINSVSPQLKDDDEKKLEIIKNQNPLMKNVSIVNRKENGYEDKFLNIVDGMGKDHLYYIDRNIDIFTLYDQMAMSYGTDITPDEFIRVVDNKLPVIKLDNYRDFQERMDISEDFQNKLKNLSKDYQGDKGVNIVGNEQHDIAIISDDRGEHKIVTYNTNEKGDLIATAHNQNVNSTTTSTMENDVELDSFSDNSIVDSSSEGVVEKDEDKDKVANLIPLDEFFAMINSDVMWNEQDRKNVDLYYAYFGDLIIYEDYLLPELKTILSMFIAYIYKWESLLSEGQVLNEHQQEACDKYKELKEKKDKVDVNDYNKVMDDVKKLTLRKPEQSKEAAFINTAQVIILIVAWAVIITVITLLLLT